MFKGHIRIVAGLATVLAAVGLVIGSGAVFTSESANAGNSFVSGTLTQSNSKNGVAIVTGDNMKPGDVKTGEVTITNTGSLTGVFKLTETNASNSFVAGALQLKIEDVTGGSATQLYSGDLDAVPSAGIDLGAYAAGAARTYRFTVTLVQSASNANQGKSASADFAWSAVQQ